MDNEAKSSIDQPPPVPNDGVPVWQEVIKDFRRIYDGQNWPWYIDDAVLNDAVVRDMKERHLVGVERYGTMLQTHNGRNALLDAYAEILDACVYLKQKILEIPEEKGLTKYVLESTYSDMLKSAKVIRKLAIPDFVKKNLTGP